MPFASAQGKWQRFRALEDASLGVVMATQLSLPRSEWKGFFDRMSKGLLGKWAEIEVASLELGDQIEAEWVPLLGITYEPGSDALDVALDRLHHSIRAPQAIVVEEDSMGLVGIDVVDGEGRRQIIRLKDPLGLPPPHART
jgi:hypothetical protein